mgnify:CR=1 FL=1|jgi:trimethylamine--corrinoid protein Co-methyltransferase
MNDKVKVRRRAGGRAARKALRAAKPALSDAPVKAGLTGGRYLPLTEEEVLRVHGAALDVLEQIGLARAIPTCIELFTEAGASMTDEGRLIIPRALVEDALAKAGRHFVLHGRDPRHDLEPWGKKVHFGTAGAAVHMVDSVTGEYRDTLLKDLYNVARLVDQLDNIHFFQRSLVARDMTDPRDLDFNTAYACVAGTTKHVGSSWVDPAHFAETMEMLHMIAGDEKRWRERPFVSMSACFVVPPLNFAEDACRVMEAGVRAGMPILLLAAGQAGATSPAALPGAVVQEVAEVLAGLVYVNLISPGHPVMFGAWPFVSDLRTGAMSGGSGEQALLMAACAQMAHFYDLTGAVAAGMTDSKLPDAQSGYEKGYTEALSGLAGGNLIYESAGMHASLLGVCYESFVIDNDIIGSVLRTVRGFEVTEDSLSVEAIRETCLGGVGHFLGSAQTLDLMERDYIYPEVGDRKSPKEWAELGSTDILHRARIRVEEILSSHYPVYIDPALDAEIRRKFDVYLPLEAMRPDAGKK